MHTENFIDKMIWILRLFQNNPERRGEHRSIDQIKLVSGWELSMWGDGEGSVYYSPYFLFVLNFTFFKRGKSFHVFLFHPLLFSSFPLFFSLNQVIGFLPFPSLELAMADLTLVWSCIRARGAGEGAWYRPGHVLGWDRKPARAPGSFSLLLSHSLRTEQPSECVRSSWVDSWFITALL